MAAPSAGTCLAWWMARALACRYSRRVEFQIGQFSIMTRLPVKTLRYYHEVGLLVPARVDDFTGYRYYAADQLERARTIIRLRSLEFSIADVAEILDRMDEGVPIQEVVAEKHAEVQARLAELLALESELRRMVASPRTGSVDVRPIAGELVASVRFTGRYGDVGRQFGHLGAAAGPLVTGPPFTLYWQDEYLPDGAEMEVCIPIARVLETDEVSCRVVPGARCVTTIHAGPYERIGDSYARAFEYTVRHDLSPTVPIRERYLRDPADPSVTGPEDYLTELAIPVEDAE